MVCEYEVVAAKIFSILVCQQFLSSSVYTLALTSGNYYFSAWDRLAKLRGRKDRSRGGGMPRRGNKRPPRNQRCNEIRQTGSRKSAKAQASLTTAIY